MTNSKLGLTLLFGVLAVGGVAISMWGPNYANEIHNTLKRAYRRDFSGYTFRGTPVGNFGVGTMYLNDIENPKIPIEERWLIGDPNSWFVDSVNAQEKQNLLKKIFEPGTLGSSSVKEEISRKLGLDVSIPVLREILSLEANVSTEKGVKVTLKASEAVNHRMNWTEFLISVREGKVKPEIVEHIQKRDFVIAADDIVLSGYQATVSVDTKVNPELKAKLDNAVGKILGKDTQLKVTISSSHAGTFEVGAVNPVVAAILFKSPPGAAPQAVANLDEWPTAKIDSDRLEALFKAISPK